MTMLSTTIYLVTCIDTSRITATSLQSIIVNFSSYLTALATQYDNMTKSVTSLMAKFSW